MGFFTQGGSLTAAQTAALAALTPDVVAAISGASSPSAGNVFATASVASLVTLLALTSPVAVAGYTALGAGATAANITSPLAGYTLTKANASGNSLNGRLSSVAAGDFAAPTAGGIHKWRVNLNTTFRNYSQYGVALYGGLTPVALFGIASVDDTTVLVIAKYTSVTAIGTNFYTELVSEAEFGSDVWFGLSRSGSTLTYWFRPSDTAQWRAVTTSNDTTDIGLASMTAAGPVMDSNGNTVGTEILTVTSSPPA